MNELGPIIYLIGAVGTEIIKDVAKHVGKKSYEIANNLREPIIQLGISDHTNPEEIQYKLNAKPELKSEIERIYLSHQNELNFLIEDLKKELKFSSNKFYSKDNDKVINIETNHGSINM